MAVEDLFNKANKMFAEKNYLGGLEVYKEIFIKFPKNVRLFDEVKKKEKKYKKPIFQSYSQLEIQEFFKLENIEHISKVIKKLTNNFSQNSNDVLTIALLGNLHGLNKDLNKAIYFQNLAIQKAPFEKVFYLNLSETLRKNDQLDKSLSILYFAKILSSNDILIDYKLAKLNTSIKNFTKADLIYDHLIRDKNINKDIVLGYCDNLIKSKKENQAISFIKKLKKNLLTDDIIHSVLGLAYFQKKEFDTAKKFLLNSISLNKNNSYPFTLLGDCFSAIGDLENAKKNYKRSLNIDPNNKMALNNLAALSFYNGDFFKAEKIYKLSVINNENNYDGLYYLAQCQLAQCDFVSGWKNFEYRWLANQFNSKKLISNLPKFKLYTESKNLLLWSEQGVGDQILFLRFLKNLEPHVNNLFITIDSRLHKIIKRISPKVNFFNKEDFSKNANIDCQIPLGDLGSLFVKDNTDLIKYNNCYLTSDFDLKKELKDNLNIKNKFICGLSWFSKNDEIGANKSITLEKLKPILSMKNIEFIDLQYNDTIDERKKFYSESGIKISKIESIDNFNDLDGLTSLIDICDFVITVSNTNAHISGALGKRTFLLLPKGKGKLWYWSSKNKKSKWYSSIEILEQKVVGSWEPVIKELVETLKDI